MGVLSLFDKRHIIIGLACLVTINLAIVSSYVIDGSPDEESENVELIELYSMGNYKDILEKIANDEQLQNDNFEKYIVSLLKTGQYEIAYESLASQVNKTPLLTTVSKTLGLYKIANYDAVDEFLSAQNNKDVHIRSLFLQLRAVAFNEMGARDAFHVLANDSWLLDPLSPSSIFLKGVSKRYAKDWSEAFKLLENAVELGYSKTKEYYFHQGIILYYLNDIEGSRENLLLAKGSEKYEYSSLIFLGRSYFDENDYVNARTYFSDALLVDSDASEAYFWLGKVYKEQDKLDLAEKTFDEGIMRDQKNLSIFLERIKLYYLKNEIDKLENSLEKEISSLLGRNEKYYEDTIRAFIQIGYLDEAIKYYNQLKTFSSEEEVLSGLYSDIKFSEFLLLLRERTVDAETFSSYVSLAKEYPKNYLALSLYLMNGKNYFQAMQYLLKYDDLLIEDLFALYAIYLVYEDRAYEALSFVEENKDVFKTQRPYVLEIILSDLSTDGGSMRSEIENNLDLIRTTISSNENIELRNHMEYLQSLFRQYY